MRHIIPYVDNSQPFGISNPSYADSLMYESQILQRADSLIPGDILVQLEIRQLLEEGFKKVDQYHRALLNGKNILLEKASSVISDDQMNKIEERIKSTISKIKSSRLNEDELSVATEPGTAFTTDPNAVKNQMGDEDWNNVMTNIQSTTDLPADGEGGGMLGMLKNLLSTLTEGGSMIGIIHLILDILGLVGDLFGNAGAIFDVLNGVIYMIRAINGDSGKWVLALISFAAAAIPFAGNIMKGMFQVSKTGKSVVKVTTEYMEAEKIVTKGGKTTVKQGVKQGSAKISDEALEVFAKAGPEGEKALEYVAKASKKSLPIVKQMLDGFFKTFLGTVVGWIPFLGKPLKKFFASISDMFDVFFKSSTKLADDVPQIIKQSHVKQIDEFFEAAASRQGTQITASGNTLIIKDSQGAILKQLDGSVLKSVNFLEKRYGPELAGEIGKKYATRTEGNVLNFYGELADNLKHIEGNYGKTLKYAGKVGKVGIKAFKFSRALTFFIGKQVAKLIMGFDVNSMTAGEIENLGAVSINQSMQDRINRELAENPKAAYVVPVLDTINDSSATEILNGTLQQQAELYNLPDIGMVAYAQNRHKDDIHPDVKDFWNFAYDDKTAEIDKIEADITPKNVKTKNNIEKTYENNSYKYIRKFKL